MCEEETQFRDEFDVREVCMLSCGMCNRFVTYTAVICWGVAWSLDTTETRITTHQQKFGEHCWVLYIFLFFFSGIPLWQHGIPAASPYIKYQLVQFFRFLSCLWFFVFTALKNKEVIFHSRSRPQEKDQKTWGSQNTVKCFWDVKCLDERGLDLIISLRTHNTVALLG